MPGVNVKFGAEVGGLEDGVNRANAALDSIKAHADNASSGFASLAEIAGVALTFEGLKSGFDDLAAFAGQITDAQARMGGSLESMTTLAGVAKLAGTSFQTLEQAVEAAGENVQRSTKDGFTPGAQALRNLGLSARELSGLSTDDWFTKVANAVSRFNPSLNLTNTVQAAFGRGITSILPLLLQGGDGFDEMAAKVRKAQEGLAAAIPGINETKEKFDLLSLSSRAFAAQVFTVLKPAIDSAIDYFSELTGKITPDVIRDAANRIANALIDIAASVARFFAEAGVAVDRLMGGISINLGKLDKVDSAVVHFFQHFNDQAKDGTTSFQRVGDMISKLREEWDKPVELKIGGGSDDATAKLDQEIQAISDAAKRAHEAVNSALPASGTWEAEAQDAKRLSDQVNAIGESFLKLNAPAVDYGVKNQLAAQSTRIEAAITAEQEKLARIKEVLNQEAGAFKLTEQQKALATETAIAQAYQAELGFINQKIALYARGSREYEAAEKEKTKLTADYEKQMLATVQASQKEMTASIEQGLQTVTGAFNSQLKGLLAGTTSWAKAMQNIAGDMFMKLIELVEQWAVKHAATIIAESALQKTQAAQDVVTQAAAEAAKTTATVTGAAARASAESAGQASGLAAQLASAVTSVFIDAGKTFAGVFGFLAPIMGPAAAGPAAASAATVAATPLAVGAWDIPSVMPAVLHPGEMVIPQTYASGLRQAISGGGDYGGGGGQGGGGGISISFSNVVGTQQFINQMMPQLARSLSAYQRLNPSTA